MWYAKPLHLGLEEEEKTWIPETPTERPTVSTQPAVVITPSYRYLVPSKPFSWFKPKPVRELGPHVIVPSLSCPKLSFKPTLKEAQRASDKVNNNLLILNNLQKLIRSGARSTGPSIGSAITNMAKCSFKIESLLLREARGRETFKEKRKMREIEAMFERMSALEESQREKRKMREIEGVLERMSALEEARRLRVEKEHRVAMERSRKAFEESLAAAKRAVTREPSQLVEQRGRQTVMAQARFIVPVLPSLSTKEKIEGFLSNLVFTIREFFK